MRRSHPVLRSAALLFALALAAGRAADARASTYALSSPGYWTEAEAEATSLGGHLVAINSAEEQQLLVSLFGGVEP